MTDIRAERIGRMETTLVTSPDPLDLSPLESAIMDVCNQLHEGAAAGDAGEVARLMALAGPLLDRYEESRGEDHPNAAWAVPNQRALVLSAAGEVEASIRAELEAMEHADTARRKEISAGNLADRFIRVGLYEDAIFWFTEARAAAPGSIPVMLTGAQALFFGGYTTQANRIFRRLLEQAQGDNRVLAEGSELAAYLDFEDRLKTMAPDLPALTQLMELWARRMGGTDGERGVS